jgi:hypothetical protein
MQCWINGHATDGIDDKINPPAADHYFYPVKLFFYFTWVIFGANSKSQKTFILSVGCRNSETLNYREVEALAVSFPY